MSENVTESDVYSPTVIVPQVGDTTYPTTVPQGMGELANRANFLVRRLRGQGSTESLAESSATAAEADLIVPADAIMGGGNLLKALAQGVANRIKYVKSKAHGLATYSAFVPPMPFGTPAGWNFISSTGGVRLQQDDTSTASFAHFSAPIVTPGPVTRLVSVRAYVRGGAHAALPGTMPTVRVFSRSHSLGGFGGGDVTELGSVQADTSSSAGNYDVFHYIDWTAPASTFVHNLGDLVILFTGEDATGAETFDLFGFRVFFAPS
jgi:hypothetical protein